MRCLWITRQDPSPANSGELIYSLGLISALSAHRFVEITVLAHKVQARVPAADSPVVWELHGSIPSGRVRSLLSRLPGDAFRLGNQKQRRELKRLLEQPWDWVIVDQAACGWVLDLLPESVSIAYIAHNVEAVVRAQVAACSQAPAPLRWALSWDSHKYASLENRLCARASLITAITPSDREYFASKFSHAPGIVLTPGYGAAPPSSALKTIDETRPRRVLLVGAFEWLAKRQNLELFLKLASEPFRQAAIEFEVVGKGNLEWFRSLARAYPDVRFRPNVESVLPHLSEARIGVIPEALGGGFKLKVLDYIFNGLPVASLNAALSGVPIDRARHAISAATMPQLVQGLVSRVDDLEFLNSAASGALEACRNAFEWSDRGTALFDALQDAAGTRRARSLPNGGAR